MSPFIETSAILENVPVSSDSHVLVLSSEKICKTVQPGQFVEVRCDPDHLVLKRPFSIFESTGETVSLYVKRVGKGSRWLQKARAGETVEIIGPLGNGYLGPFDGKSLLIGGGCGIASLKMLSRTIKENGGVVDAIFGFRIHAEVPEQVIAMFKLHVESLTVTLETSDFLKTETVVDRLREANIDDYERFFVCGPSGMMKALLRILPAKDTQVSLEMRMACGLGVCYGCSVSTIFGRKRVCHDGPVFSMEEVDWNDL